MSNPSQSFLEQYKENCRRSTRSAPYRLLRLVVAFFAALVLAPVCAAAAAITGEPMAAMVVGVVGIVGIFLVWRVIERSLAGSASPPQPVYPQPGFGLPTAGESPFAASLSSGQPPSFAPPSFAPSWSPPAASPPPAVQTIGNFPPQPAPKSGGGFGLVLLAVLGVMALSCCGGGVALIAIGARFGVHANGQAGGQPNDPFDQMQRQQQRQLDDLIRRQNDQWREIEGDRQRFGQGPGF